MLHRRILRPVTLFICLLAWSAIAAAQTAPIRYTAALDPMPTSHMLHMSIAIDAVTTPSVDVAMPAWSPGAYTITNAWRQVQEFSPADGGNAPLKFEKVDKQTWRVYRGKDDKVTVRYTLYAPEYTDDLCYLRGPQVFMYVIGKAPYPVARPISLKLEAPPNWRAQTGMESSSDGTFQAPDYDTFVDASVLIGPNWEQTSFEYKGVPHYVVFIGKGNYNKQLITDDTKKIVSTLTDMMGGAPYKKYVFFLTARAFNGSGGLEHLNSTDITFSANGTHANRASYSRFLFVVAHEYFHLWNVKRIRPQILGPFDYSHEQNTRNLYVSEGMTSYWAALGLRRSGLWTQQEYFDEVATQITILESAPGRKIMSVELSSWDTWNQGSNAANNRIDYYNKGELLGNLLDLEIRHRTKNQRTLLDVFHYLYANYALPKPGFEEKQGFRNAVEKITAEAAPNNADFGDFFAKYVSGTADVPWDDFFRHAGLTVFQDETVKAQPSIGIDTGTSIPSNFPGGAPTVLQQGQLGITRVKPGSSGYNAGLDVGDILVAIDDQQVTPTNYNELWQSQKSDRDASFTIMRRGVLKTIPVHIAQVTPVVYKISERKDADDQQKKIMFDWLEGK